MKTERLHIEYPKNSSSEMEDLLREKITNSVNLPKIKQVKNVFVTHDGLVLKNGLLVKGCAFNLKGNEDKTFYYTFWRDTIEKFAVCKWGKSLKSIHLKGPQKYLLIHSKWFNYSFWINGFLPRLIQAEDEGLLKTTKLIVPEGWKDIPYVWESLKAFEIQIEMIPIDHHIFVDYLIMPETRKWTASFVPSTIKRTNERLVKEALLRVSSKNIETHKVYLTRSSRGVRCIENEDEVIASVQKWGYKVIKFEDLSIWEQIKLMNNTTHFISIHGAGFSNLLFMKEGSTVLELVNKPYAKAEYTFPFWKLANASSVNYYMQLCEVNSPENSLLSYGKDSEISETKYLVNQNIIVDLTLLEENIQLMEFKF